jgi:hypothetical protein
MGKGERGVARRAGTLYGAKFNLKDLEIEGELVPGQINVRGDFSSG